MYEYKAKVTRVVDGDTVDLLIDVGFNIHIKERARLYGIDAPESRTRDLEEKKRGLASKARLIEILESFGDTIVVKTSIDKGKYGRLLAELLSQDGDQNANQMLISEGHATEYFGGKK
jgi:micrococcal nuclease|tara:strand:- start:1503 stop:1856 length:354 start_codon:yes stop_codon:yes gene_type:complete